MPSLPTFLLIQQATPSPIHSPRLFVKTPNLPTPSTLSYLAITTSSATNIPQLKPSKCLAPPPLPSPPSSSPSPSSPPAVRAATAAAATSPAGASSCKASPPLETCHPSLPLPVARIALHRQVTCQKLGKSLLLLVPCFAASVSAAKKAW